jgi:hypothetical protein
MTMELIQSIIFVFSDKKAFCYWIFFLFPKIMFFPHFFVSSVAFVSCFSHKWLKKSLIQDFISTSNRCNTHESR